MSNWRWATRLVRTLVLLLLAGQPLYAGAVEAAGTADPSAPVTVMIAPNQSPSEIDAAIRAAAQGGRPVVVQLQTPPTPAPASAPAPAPATKAPAAPAVTTNEMWMFADLWGALTNGTQMSIAGLRGLPSAFRSSWETLLQEENGPSRAAGFGFLAVLCAAALTYAVDRLVQAVLQRHRPQHTLLLGLLRLVADGFAIGIFAAVSHSIVKSTLHHGSFSREVAIALVSIVIGVLVYAAIGRFFLRPALKGSTPLIEIAHPNWHFSMLVTYGALSMFISNSVRLADLRMVDADAADSWLFLTVTVLTVLKLWWFIRGRQDIAEAFTGKDAAGFRRVVGHFLADFYTVSAILIWAAGLVVAGTAQNTVWARAAGLTQFLLIIIPIIDHGIFSALGSLARKREATHGKGLGSVILWSLRAPLAGVVWLAGLHIILLQWQPMMMGAVSLITLWLAWLERLSLALIASWTLCGFLLKYFETIAPATTVILPGQEVEENSREASRLTTILPIVRNLILGAVVAIASLVVISSAGIDVAPLLAGFGVLGLAFSFGSQSLVKDIVSGIFFLAEDAFRIGEYIDSGKLMGTVEQITIRSVRLRHHNGPIHTIPFGQMSSVTNYSRDWGTTKFELRFDRDADPEAIRKVAKKVGLALLEDPEFGSEFLVPLKMQGIQNVTETSLVVRFKFTAKPGKPSLIKREGMKRLLIAFKAADIPLASNAVTVRGGAQAQAQEAAAASIASASIIPMPANQM